MIAPRCQPLVALALLAATCCPRTAHAFFLPPFQLDENAWNADEILIVTEGKSIDGRVRVLETWHGTTRIGAEITVPGLERFAVEERRRIHDRSELTTRTVSGRRIALFLRREKGELVAVDRDRIGGIAISCAWIENGRAHAECQVMFSGARHLVEHGTETDLRARALIVTELREKLERARDTKTKTLRMKRLFELASSEIMQAARDSIAEIEKLGAADARAPLLELLESESLPGAALLFTAHALRRLFPDECAPWIVAALGREVEYWRARTSAAQASLDRIHRTEYVIEVVALVGTPQGKGPLEALLALIPERACLRPHARTLQGTCERALKRIESWNAPEALEARRQASARAAESSPAPK